MLALLSIAGVANAQQYETWIDISDQAKAWVHEWRYEVDETGAPVIDSDVKQTDGEARTDADGAYYVEVRSTAQATEAGNMIKDGDNMAGWDSQFFITFGEDNALKAGDKIQVTMNVKALSAASQGTQAHTAPGSYKHWGCIPSVSFTTEWATYDSGQWEVVSDAAGMYSIAFNLADGNANTYYFSDIVVKIWKKKPVEKWTSIIKNGDFEGEGTDNFIITQHAVGGGRYNCAIVDGVGCADVEKNEDGTNGITFQSSGKESLGWDSQFFVFFDKKIPAGTQVHVKFDYKAKEDGKADTQSHNTPGNYIHWACIGDVNFSTAWQTFDDVITVSGDMSKSDKPFESIAFNIANQKKWNIYYFDNFVVEVAEDVYATLEDADAFESAGLQKVLPEDPLAAVKADLEAAIAKGGLFTDYLKTAESYEALQTAISDGEDALSASDATQTSLEAAVAAINRAIDGLTYEEGYDKLVAAGMFKRYKSTAADAEVDEENQGCSYDLGKSSGLPYGDGNVGELNWADLTAYDKLIVVAVDGTPRFCMNRLEAGGQQAETQEDSKMLDINPNNGYTWSTEKYQTVDGNTYTIDLKAIVADYGFARLHSIKGSNYGNATIIDMILVKGADVETVTIGEDLWASFAPSKDVTVPEGVKAYAVALDESNKFVTLEEVTEITAGTPVIVNATEAGEYTFEAADGASFSASNDLDVSDGSIVGNGSIYVLANGSNDVGFYLLAEGVTLPAGKAYLEVAGGAREFIGFGNATAIKAIETLKNNGVIYNLTGQQVKSAQKGVFIVNGKKVIK